MSNMLTNGAIFSTFKRTDSHTVRGGPSRKDGAVIYDRILRNGSFRELKIAKESHDLAKFSPESNQNSNGLSVNRTYVQSVTTDKRIFTKLLGADGDKVQCDQTVRNDNEYAMLDCKSSFHPSEDKLKHNCHSYVTSVIHDHYIFYVFA